MCIASISSYENAVWTMHRKHKSYLQECTEKSVLHKTNSYKHRSNETLQEQIILPFDTKQIVYCHNT